MTKKIDAKKIKDWLSDNQEISFIDVREIGQHTAGHPFFSISIPYSIFEFRLLEIVPNKNVRIVLIDNDNGISDLAAKQADKLGYKNIFILESGVDGWLNAGFKLFDGINVPSKTFGELIEHKYHTPSITPNELFNKQQQKKDIIILDGRPFEEYEKMSIPGSICCPNAEIPYKASSLVKDAKTEIIVNCAGRTRSIIGAQALINFGIENKVYALENGTQGWFLSDLKLDHGKKNYLDLEPNKIEIEKLRSRIKFLLNENKIEILNLKKANNIISNKIRSTYIFDVSSQKLNNDVRNYIQNVPGGQLVQATDNFIGVLKSQIILLDEGDLVRAGMTALWLKKLNFDCYVLEINNEEIKSLIIKNKKEYEYQSYQKLTLDELQITKNTLIFDTRYSENFCKSRLKQSTWLNRSNLKDYDNLNDEKIILVCDDNHKISLIHEDLKIKFPKIDLKVYHWDEKDVDRFSQHFDTNEIPMSKNYIDFNFHTYLRHKGNKEHAQQYLKWETGLIERMDEEETMFFKDL